ncbi:hypothetical protein FSST1_010353 [Fusarium sambucinum]
MFLLQSPASPRFEARSVSILFQGTSIQTRVGRTYKGSPSSSSFQFGNRYVSSSMQCLWNDVFSQVQLEKAYGY